MAARNTATGRVRRLAERHWLLAVLLGAVPVIEYLAVLQGGPAPSLALVRNPFAAIAAASVFVRYYVFDLRGRTRKWIVYLTPATWIAPVLLEGSGAPPELLWLDMLAGLGVLGALGFLVGAAMAKDQDTRSRYTDQLLHALLLPLGASMVSYGLWSTYGLNPVYDTRIYAFEEMLGVKFSLLGVSSYRALAPLSTVATACYTFVGGAIALVAAAQLDERRDRDVLAAALVAGACGFALYFVCPVVGPLNAFAPVYPAALPALSADAPLLTAPWAAPRNGMPSLHAIWALLVWFNARPLPAFQRRCLGAFAALTLWAAMGLEDTHWMMDVVVGVPLAVAIQAVVIDRRSELIRSLTTASTCITLTVAWLVVFRGSFPILGAPSWLAWAAVAATVCWPLYRVRPAGRTSMNVGEAARGAAVRKWDLTPAP